MRRKAPPLYVLLTVAAVLYVGGAGALSHSAWPATYDPFVSLKVSRLSGTEPFGSFELKALDGRTVHSSDLAGKVVLLNFWATWCGPCKEEMPSLARLQQQLDPELFRIVTVTSDMYPQGIRQFLTQLGIGLPVLFDEDQELSRRLMVRGLPTTILIAEDGHPVGRAVGPRSWDSQDAVALMRQVSVGKR